jgi:hypothetical protein
VGDLPVVELPFLAGGVGGPDGVRALARRLAEVPEEPGARRSLRAGARA